MFDIFKTKTMLYRFNVIFYSPWPGALNTLWRKIHTSEYKNYSHVQSLKRDPIYFFLSLCNDHWLRNVICEHHYGSCWLCEYAQGFPLPQLFWEDQHIIQSKEVYISGENAQQLNNFRLIKSVLEVNGAGLKCGHSGFDFFHWAFQIVMH